MMIRRGRVVYKLLNNNNNNYNNNKIRFFSFNTNRNVRINKEINVSKVRLIDKTIINNNDNNNNNNNDKNNNDKNKNKKKNMILSLNEAIKLAKSKGVDVIEVVPTAKPPVCHLQKVSDYLYQQRLKDKKLRKSMSSKKLKEVTFTDAISDNDFNTKLTRCVKWLNDGHNIRMTATGFTSESRQSLLERTCDWLIDCGEMVSKIRDSGMQLKEKELEELTPEQLLLQESKGKATVDLKPRK